MTTITLTEADRIELPAPQTLTIKLTEHEAFVVELALQRQLCHYLKHNWNSSAKDTEAVIGKFIDQLPSAAAIRAAQEGK